MGLMDKGYEGEELAVGRGREGEAHGSVMWVCKHHIQGELKNVHRVKALSVSWSL